MLRAWLAERQVAPTEPLFPTTTGKHLSRDAIERRLARHVATAAASCPSIASKHVTAHTLRHTAAMRLLLSGVDVTVIALWLGHEQISTTTSTCTPTWPRRNEQSLEPPHPTPNPAAIKHPTRSWPSWTACDTPTTSALQPM